MIKQFLPKLSAVVLLALVSTTLVSGQNKKKKQGWPDNAIAKFKGHPNQDEKKIIAANLPTATAEPKQDRRLLCFWRCEGFIHTSIPFCNEAVEQISAATSAYAVDLADDYSVFTAENLAKYDAILFNNTTHLKPDEKQRKAILDFIQGGKGIIGFHAAADNFGGWDEGVAMMGGIFNGHPWNAGGSWAFKLDDPDHPINAAFKGKGFWHKDEIYWYKAQNFQGRERLRILMSLDMSKVENQKPITNNKKHKTVDCMVGGKVVKKPLDTEAARAEVDVAVSWIRELGEGRLFYTNLGHNNMTFADRTILQHMLDGMQYAMGDIEADAVPSAGLKLVPALAPDKE